MQHMNHVTMNFVHFNLFSLSDGLAIHPLKYRLDPSGLDPAYDQRRRHHCLSAVHGCQLSVIELF